MTESQEIEEILMESSAFGVRTEVLDMASKFMKENPSARKVDAYQDAYNKLTR